ncbi:leucine-rich repeat extensin-like protein 3 [Homarus americanus]|uniref:leucine-rich repeat extensin-like protein 3 n=1 Tax=Homarus americanus TaxID=6706 RepID=UPI001C478444|nr:leucine-rich repeat extensin-like protein 3 [Homarus americanus]
MTPPDTLVVATVHVAPGQPHRTPPVVSPITPPWCLMAPRTPPGVTTTASYISRTPPVPSWRHARHLVPRNAAHTPGAMPRRWCHATVLAMTPPPGVATVRRQVPSGRRTRYCHDCTASVSLRQVPPAPRRLVSPHFAPQSAHRGAARHLVSPHLHAARCPHAPPPVVSPHFTPPGSHHGATHAAWCPHISAPGAHHGHTWCRLHTPPSASERHRTPPWSIATFHAPARTPPGGHPAISVTM